MTTKTDLVTGAGGFIGGHLVSRLIAQGHDVRAVDIKPLHEWHQVHDLAENLDRIDLRLLDSCDDVCAGVDNVYNLAADMGGMGFIENFRLDCMLSTLISTHMLMSASKHHIERFFYSSSACVYAADRQTTPDVTALREADAYPAMPEDGYGWEKLFAERMARHFREDAGLETRVARYHNVYGPHGTYDGGREKAPAAICRKVATATLTGATSIEVWGDGEQTRSFMYVDDCVEGTLRLMRSDVREPLNIGSSELVSINQLIDMVETVAGVERPLERVHNMTAPQGVRGRNSDNWLISERLGWFPPTTLMSGLERTYRWVYDEVAGRKRSGRPLAR